MGARRLGLPAMPAASRGMTRPIALSPAQVLLVRASYAAIAPLEEDYSARFYHRLLQRHPFTRSLFPDDMAQQISVFRLTIDALIAQLDQPGASREALAELGYRHVGYGVLTHHYDYVGSVLIDTLAEMAGDRFDAETRAAWETLYAAVAQAMLDPGRIHG
ncbi:globin domain-containing protein [Sphingomonas sp. BK580]|uniref:globin domain-containing protein n=1 Tax=Sphingomonas sp. BK580 TaxID=2586972 RepID=UPI00160CF1CB|nr:globin domain-containing protein [Sphingomonas sp. BK580]MBB3694571.1 nitric oxide dioxygenase [Sphingomonas sp. BK580]